VIGAEGKTLEVQIRTHEMHRDARSASRRNWRYKEGSRRARGKGDPADERIAWLRQMLAWRDEIVDSSDWKEQYSQAVVDDTVYVLTPQGKVVDLPKGATPVEFRLRTPYRHRPSLPRRKK